MLHPRLFGGRAIILLGLVIASTKFSAAAIIVAAPGPGDTPGDLFDVSNSGNTYALGPGTAFNPAGYPPGYDVRDIFGGEFSSYAPERGQVVFADNQPIGTVETVLVTLSIPVALRHVDLWVADDGISGTRSMREFKLLADTTLIDDVTVLDNSGTQSYPSRYGGSVIRISDDISGAPTTASYTLEFVQNQISGPVSGLRVVEFDGAIPEPSSFGILAAGSLGVGSRRALSRGRKKGSGVLCLNPPPVA